MWSNSKAHNFLVVFCLFGSCYIGISVETIRQTPLSCGPDPLPNLSTDLDSDSEWEDFKTFL